MNVLLGDTLQMRLLASNVPQDIIVARELLNQNHVLKERTALKGRIIQLWFLLAYLRIKTEQAP